MPGDELNEQLPNEDDAYDNNSVDRTLIRWMLSLSPTERLEQVQGTIDLQRNVRKLRDGDG